MLSTPPSAVFWRVPKPILRPTAGRYCLAHPRFCALQRAIAPLRLLAPAWDRGTRVRGSGDQAGWNGALGMELLGSSESSRTTVSTCFHRDCIGALSPFFCRRPTRWTTLSPTLPPLFSQCCWAPPSPRLATLSLSFSFSYSLSLSPSLACTHAAAHASALVLLFMRMHTCSFTALLYAPSRLVRMWLCLPRLAASPPCLCRSARWHLVLPVVFLPRMGKR